MSDSSDRETRWLRGAGILSGVTAVALFVLASLGIFELPLFLPLLLLAAASGLMLASRRGSS
ncbi:MAG: hypothetical protein P8Y21_06165 [Gemmatimonadales bacterium]|jgi:hypothetical protein